MSLGMIDAAGIGARIKQLANRRHHGNWKELGARCRADADTIRQLALGRPLGRDQIERAVTLILRQHRDVNPAWLWHGTGGPFDRPARPAAEPTSPEPTPPDPESPAMSSNGNGHPSAASTGTIDFMLEVVNRIKALESKPASPPPPIDVSSLRADLMRRANEASAKAEAAEQTTAKLEQALSMMARRLDAALEGLTLANQRGLRLEAEIDRLRETVEMLENAATEPAPAAEPEPETVRDGDTVPADERFALRAFMALRGAAAARLLAFMEGKLATGVDRSIDALARMARDLEQIRGFERKGPMVKAPGNMGGSVNAYRADTLRALASDIRDRRGAARLAWLVKLAGGLRRADQAGA
jgi:hypothetical protein